MDERIKNGVPRKLKSGGLGQCLQNGVNWTIEGGVSNRRESPNARNRPRPKDEHTTRRNRMGKIQRAIISVTDKTGIVDFARSLSKFGVEILSTGGTAKALRDGGLSVTDVSDYTGFPEMMDGRVKTLHPKVHGGLLGMRDNPRHVKSMNLHGIRPIDMLVVNLYQFEKTVAKKGVTLEEAIENIDIGGPAMLRSAAKNFKDVTVIVDPADYEVVLEEMEKTGGETNMKTRFHLARKVFRLTHRYDGAIADYLNKTDL
jgi:phosphoribosylaminoimidazolecarboxamide formyltransferase/IMP cyclohydrolase